jgi:DNA relaxase NicK
MYKLIEASVDWLSITVKDARCAGRLASIWQTICATETRRGGVISIKSRLGYDGASIGGSFWGLRTDGWLMVLTGKIAAQYFSAVYECGVNITRLDLQVTVEHDVYEPDAAERAVLAAFGHRGSAPNRNWPKIRHLRSFGEGDTATIGSRQSQKYGRIYDKQKEQRNGSYERCWRWEIEYKSDYAKLVAAQLYAPSHGLLSIASIVRSQFAEWGFDLSIPDSVVDLPTVPTGTFSDTDKTLDWLAKQVSPSVARLLQNGVDKALLYSILGL